MATGCVKIVKRAKEFDPSTGKFIPEEKRAKSVDLFKGRWSEDDFDFVFIKRMQVLHEGLSFIKSNAGCILFQGHFRFFFSFIHEFVT